MNIFCDFIINGMDMMVSLVMAVLKFLFDDVLTFMSGAIFMDFINIVLILSGIILGIFIIIGVVCRAVGVEPGEIDKAMFIIQKGIYKKYFLR